MTNCIQFKSYNKDTLAFMEERGIGGNVFWNSPKPIYQGQDCDWPTEKEVFARRLVFIYCTLSFCFSKSFYIILEEDSKTAKFYVSVC